MSLASVSHAYISWVGCVAGHSIRRMGECTIPYEALNPLGEIIGMIGATGMIRVIYG